MRFKPGDAVRACVENPSGHTRLPAYLRGRWGEVERVYPSLGGGPLYTVRFDAREVWGGDAPARVTILADLAEPYLENS